ncbi:MAG: hypothetical protein Q7U56_10445 [Humidesulfovibrio sp.]|nr:hypothetical protein [Humidesulfovibrio sp.]
MNLSAIDSSRGCDWLADWFELKALAEGAVSFMDHIDALVDRDVAEEDIDADEVALEQARDRISDEIGRRIAWLGDAYPFSLEDYGYTLKLREELFPGHQSYILCLWLTAIITDMLRGETIRATRSEQNLFQFCSTVASASFLEGYAFSFGFPRPEGGGILTGLSHLHAFGFPEGQPQAEILPWMNGSAKDDEVDVIAWRTVNDSLPGVVCLYGQVASGGNWEKKSLTSDKIKAFQDAWYAIRPASRPCLAIFVPVCPWAQVLDSHGIPDYKRKLYNKTLEFGIIFSRYRIPHYVDKYFSEELGQANIDNTSLINTLESWSRDLLGRLRA